MVDPQPTQPDESRPEQSADSATPPVGPTESVGAEKQPPVDPRPRPAYGEYAPEGWEWKPPGEAAPEGAASGGGAQSSGPVPPTVPGVPHNLGAGAALPGRSSRSSSAPSDTSKPSAPSASQHSHGAPYRAAPPAPPAQPGSTAEPSAPPAAPGAQAPNAQPQFSPARQEVESKAIRPADRVVTILLLVAGALGAMQLSYAMMSIGHTFNLIGDVPEIGGFTSPDWLSTTGKVTGFLILAFYAVTLVYSIRRLRTGKLTFWVPLVAGAIALLAFVAVIVVAMFSIPDLAAILADPDKTAKLMEHVRSLQGLSTP